MNWEDEEQSDFYLILTHYFSIYFDLRIIRKISFRAVGLESKTERQGCLYTRCYAPGYVLQTVLQANCNHKEKGGALE
jgi:hypothetical protein